MNVRKKKLGAFKDELTALYRKHGVSIGHEDHHGAFIIRDLREDDIRLIKNATNEAMDRTITADPSADFSMRSDLKDERDRCAAIADTASCVFDGPSLRTEGFGLAKDTIAQQIRDGVIPRKVRGCEPPQAMPFSKTDGSYDTIAETEAALRGVHPNQVASDGAPIWRDCLQCGNPTKAGRCDTCGAPE